MYEGVAFMMKCKQATQLMSQSQDRNLTRVERIQLKLHLLMCSGCAQYNKQMALLRNAMQQIRRR